VPIEFKREGNACERCKKQDTEVGKITHYTEHGSDLLLCPKCLKKEEEPYTEICPKCKKRAYEHGGMTVFGDEPEDFEEMCIECYEKKESKDAKRDAIKLTIKNFMKDHWKFLISISISIVAVAIALSRL